jgi:hypothetical protein
MWKVLLVDQHRAELLRFEQLRSHRKTLEIEIMHVREVAHVHSSIGIQGPHSQSPWFSMLGCHVINDSLTDRVTV